MQTNMDHAPPVRPIIILKLISRDDVAPSTWMHVNPPHLLPTASSAFQARAVPRYKCRISPSYLTAVAHERKRRAAPWYKLMQCQLLPKLSRWTPCQFVRCLWNTGTTQHSVSKSTVNSQEVQIMFTPTIIERRIAFARGYGPNCHEVRR